MSAWASMTGRLATVVRTIDLQCRRLGRSKVVGRGRPRYTDDRSPMEIGVSNSQSNLFANDSFPLQLASRFALLSVQLSREEDLG